MIIAVAASLCSLEIIALARSNIAEAWPASHDIYYNRWELARRKIRYAFLLEAYARAGRRCHCPCACEGGAENHIYGGDFTLCLYKNSSDFRHVFSHIHRQFVLRSNRVPRIKPAPCAYSALCKDLIAAHQDFFCLHLYTIIERSGQTMAQNEHPVHLFSSKNRAGRTPFLFIELPILIQALGQYSTKSLHPLHLSLSNSIRGIVKIPSGQFFSWFSYNENRFFNFLSGEPAPV